MSLILNGNTGISGVDGTAGTPALQGNDTNTGVSFGTDTVTINTGGTARVTTDASGNVGLGATPSAWNALFKVFEIGTAASFVGTFNSADIYMAFNGYFDTSWKYKTSNFATRYTQGNGAHTWFTAPSGTAGNAISFTQAMTLDASGNLLVGRTTALGGHSFQNTQETTFYRPTTNGNLSINSYWSDVGGTQTVRAYFKADGGLANYSANNINLSDRREKLNFSPAKNYLDVICAVPVQTYNYIGQETDDLTLGVVAQDLQAVAPELVTESNWGTEDEPKMRLSIYQTDLQYALMKCIQEQQALITQLQADVAALKGAA